MELAGLSFIFEIDADDGLIAAVGEGSNEDVGVLVENRNFPGVEKLTRGVRREFDAVGEITGPAGTGEDDGFRAGVLDAEGVVFTNAGAEHFFINEAGENTGEEELFLGVVEIVSDSELARGVRDIRCRQLGGYREFLDQFDGVVQKDVGNQRQRQQGFDQVVDELVVPAIIVGGTDQGVLAGGVGQERVGVRPVPGVIEGKVGDAEGGLPGGGSLHFLDVREPVFEGPLMEVADLGHDSPGPVEHGGGGGQNRGAKGVPEAFVGNGSQDVQAGDIETKQAS